MRSIEIARKIFLQVTNRLIIVDSLEEAELAKLYCNIYRDTIFAIGNVFCMAAQEFGVDGINVIRSANDGYPRSNIAQPGFVGGPCLGKDANLLTSNMPECLAKDFILAERNYNKQMEDIVVGWVERKGKNKVIAISGMSFKGVPETSDLRGSSSVYIAQKLCERGYALRLHDFAALPDELNALKVGKVCESIYEACESADILLVLNNNKRYADVQANGTMRQPDFAILDAWGVCAGLTGGGANVATLGNINIGGSK